jgi:hypothetical protein
MAILEPVDDEYPTADARCFLCSEHFNDEGPVVFWRGGGGQRVYWHGDCSASFVLRFARDAWEIQRDADDGKS